MNFYKVKWSARRAGGRRYTETDYTLDRYAEQAVQHVREIHATPLNGFRIEAVYKETRMGWEYVEVDA